MNCFGKCIYWNIWGECEVVTKRPPTKEDCQYGKRAYQQSLREAIREEKQEGDEE